MLSGLPNDPVIMRAIGLLAEDCQLGMHIGEMRVSRTAQELDRVVTLRHMDTLTRTQRELSRPVAACG